MFVVDPFYMEYMTFSTSRNMCGPMYLLIDWGVIISTFLPNKSSKKKARSMKLSNDFCSGIKSTSRSMSLFSVEQFFANDPKSPIDLTP